MFILQTALLGEDELEVLTYLLELLLYSLLEHLGLDGIEHGLGQELVQPELLLQVLDVGLLVQRYLHILTEVSESLHEKSISKIL